MSNSYVARCLALSSLSGWLLCASVPVRAGHIVVLNKGDATGQIIQVEGEKTQTTFATGVGPHEVALSPDGRTAVAANYGGMKHGQSLTVIDLPSGKVTRTIDLKDFNRPHGLAFFKDGVRLAVTAEVQQAVIVVDILQGTVIHHVETGQTGTHMLVLSPDESRIYASSVGSGSVSVIDAVKWELIKNIPTYKGAEGLDLSPDGRELWVANNQAGTITVIDTETFESTATIPCPGFPIRLKFTPDGLTALVTSVFDGKLRILDLKERKELAAIDLGAEGMELPPAPPQLGDSFAPIGIIAPPDHGYAYVALARSGEVVQVDLAKRVVSKRWKAGQQPDGIAFTTALVPAPADRQPG